VAVTETFFVLNETLITERTPSQLLHYITLITGNYFYFDWLGYHSGKLCYQFMYHWVPQSVWHIVQFYNCLALISNFTATTKIGIQANVIIRLCVGFEVTPVFRLFHYEIIYLGF